jgi:hypothetical protein
VLKNKIALGHCVIEVEGNCEIVELYEIFNIFVQRE